LLNWMQVSRIVRASFLSLKEQDFVLSARASGVDNRAIMVRHILPNTLAPVIVAATLGIGHAIILEASASFLGLGVQPPTASWGSTLNRAQEVMVMAPWVAVFPGLMILLTVLCVNFIGDGLRDALDPHATRT
jgi:peptide/nickel transport system permease protein